MSGSVMKVVLQRGRLLVMIFIQRISLAMVGCPLTFCLLPIRLEVFPMRKLLAIGLTLFALFSVSVSAAEYKEGVHYTVMRDQVSKTPEITEYFSYYCSHCFQFAPVMEKLKDQLPEGVEFRQSYVDWLPNGRPDLGELMSRTFATAQMLGVTDKVSGLIFDYNFIKKAPIVSRQDVHNVFVVAGVNGDDFDSAFDSFTANTKVAAMKDAYKRDKVNATPTLIVNDKYRVETAGLQGTKDFTADYIKLVNYLLTLK